MPDIEIKRLRKLRRRAETLLDSLVLDLKPFRHEWEKNGFLRTPDSKSFENDLNVTTTCSCLMGLALSGKLPDFYGKGEVHKTTSKEIFDNVFNAHWMSSGLGEDNAFSTTLVIRLFGFLVEAGVLTTVDAERIGGKSWEPKLEARQFPQLANRLAGGKDPFSKFLFELFPKDLQKEIEGFSALSNEESKKVEKRALAEIDRLVRTSSFYDERRFENVPLSSQATELVGRKKHTYDVVKLNRILLHEVYKTEFTPLRKLSLKLITEAMADPWGFGINDYPSSATVVYWFVDGIARSEIDWLQPTWEAFCTFAASEFGKQRSLAVAKHAAMMDPVAMAMSACLCSRLRFLGEKRHYKPKDPKATLPSVVELERAIIDLFGEQTDSGIWPKYFPLFHYQDAGSNFCFTFEMLEAVLFEFGGRQSKLLAEELIVAGLERAISWCESNRLEFSTANDKSFQGWNSGGNLETLRRGQPESWPTAVVHMFLWELVEALSRFIQERLLERYAAQKPTPKWNTLKTLMDIDLWLDNQPASLVKTLEASIVKTFKGFEGPDSEKLRKTPAKDAVLSALLFGPPGTSKTELAKTIARELRWPLVEIDPSHFVQDTFQNIYVRAEQIFDDVMDLCGVVVLFDEMDALMQRRDAGSDTESKFLTTYMLPKLAKLHDRGRIVFLMATNFQASFDDAIKRAGRFDYLLCMGPPTLPAKCKSIHSFFDLLEATDETRDAGRVILEYAAADAWLEDQLTLYTFAEFKGLLSQIGCKDDIGTQARARRKEGFLKLVKDDCRSSGLRLDDLKNLKKFSLKRWARPMRLKDMDGVSFREDKIKKAELDRILAVKYVLDRKQTRRQCLQKS